LALEARHRVKASATHSARPTECAHRAQSGRQNSDDQPDVRCSQRSRSEWNCAEQRPRQVEDRGHGDGVAIGRYPAALEGRISMT
jgi:hypothetical protein